VLALSLDQSTSAAKHILKKAASIPQIIVAASNGAAGNVIQMVIKIC
jgi:hypothetical protein